MRAREPVLSQPRAECRPAVPIIEREAAYYRDRQFPHNAPGWHQETLRMHIPAARNGLTRRSARQGDRDQELRRWPQPRSRALPDVYVQDAAGLMGEGSGPAVWIAPRERPRDIETLTRYSFEQNGDTKAQR